MPVVNVGKGDIMVSPRQTLVCTINTVGAMGAGVAKAMRNRVPGLWKFYRKLYEGNMLRVDKMYVYPWGEKQILLFPTKRDWKNNSQAGWIENNLARLSVRWEDMGITSMAFPPLGCGNGNLDFAEIEPLMRKYLDDLPFETDIVL